HFGALPTLWQAHPAAQFFEAVGWHMLDALLQADGLPTLLLHMQMAGGGTLQQATLLLLRDLHGTGHRIACIGQDGIACSEPKVSQSLGAMPIGQLHLLHASGTQITAL